MAQVEVYVHFHPVSLEVDEETLKDFKAGDESAKQDIVEQLLVCLGENDGGELSDAIETVVKA